MKNHDARDRDDRARDDAHEAWEASLHGILVPGRCELEGIGPKTRQSIAAARVHGAHDVAMEPLFRAARVKVDAAVARTLRRAAP